MPSAVKMVEIMKAAICIAAALWLMHVVTAEEYIVGNPTGGWDGRTDYKSWAAAQTFALGDTIVFKYNSYHNVVEVSHDDYEACSATSPVFFDNSGSTSILLTAPGKRYFICGGPGHCHSGMKMEIDVADRPAPTTPSPPPLLPPPQHEKQQPAWAPMALPPAAMASPPAPAPAPAAAPPRHSGHKKHKRRHCSPAPAPAKVPTVQSVEAYLPVAAFAPMSSPPPPPPMSSDAAAVLRVKWIEAIVGLLALAFVVLAQ